MQFNFLVTATAGYLFFAPCASAITVDGTVDVGYGVSRAVQTVQTGFGDQTSPGGLGGGGELDAAYAVIEGGRLFVTITGNIENNFNKLGVFIDAKPGGENVLSATPRYDFENISQNYRGLTFDAGFAADYHLYARWGSLTGSVFTVDIVDRDGGTRAALRGNGDRSSVGGGTAIQAGTVDPGDLGLGSTGVGEVRNLAPFLTESLDFGFNNTNTAGVGSNAGAAANQAAAAAVTTGFEFSMDLHDLGGPMLNDTIKMHVVYGNSNNNFHSNQTLGGLPVGSGNLSNDGGGGLSHIDFSDIVGDQFFTVDVPGLPGLVGDYNASDQVDQGDLDLVLQNWGVDTGTAGVPSGWRNDLPSGQIEQAELDGVLQHWGSTRAPDFGHVMVPQPATVLVLLTGLLARRRTDADSSVYVVRSWHRCTDSTSSTN